MAKKRKKSAHLEIGSLRIPKPMITAVKRALDTPVGKVILAEALVQMATVLVSKQPTAAAAAAGAGAATAGKDFPGSLRDAAAGLMQSAAEALRSGVTAGKGSSSGDHARKNNADERQDGDIRTEAAQGKTIREVLLSEIQKKNRKKGKTAHGH